MQPEPKYWAFISYSHADEKWAKWLQRAIESYTIPKHLVGRASSGWEIPKRLQPVFRDRLEFAASSNLRARVQAALKDSRYLIVLCSPEAAQSTWVNQEIHEFKAARGGENILCAVVGPAANAHQKRQDLDACFPPALLKGGDVVEPLAADLRRAFDGRRMGKLKIIAGLLGIGLDELVQRDTQRRHHRMLALTAGSIAGMGIMAFLALSALFAQQEEAKQKARAEEMVEFMLGDLRAQLKPVGSLDTLASLSEQALQYYASLDPGDLNREDQIRRARALLAIGEIENLRGDIDSADTIFEDALKMTSELLADNPDNTARIYDQGQSVYWLGYLDWQHARLDEAAEHFVEYMRLAQRLTELEPENQEFQKELVNANINLGVLQMEQGQLEAAIESFSASRDIREQIRQSHPEDSENVIDLANAHGWIGQAQEDFGNLEAAYENRVAQTEILESLRQSQPGNTDVSAQLVTGWTHLGRLSLAAGDLKMAEQQLIRSIELARLLLQLDSRNTYWSNIAGLSYLAYGDLLLWAERWREAERMLRDGAEIADWLIQQDNNVLDWQVDLAARAEELLARLDQGRGQSAEALARLERLTERLMDLAEQYPNDRDVASRLAAAQLYCGEVLSAVGRPEEATARWQQTADTLGAQTAPLPIGDRAVLALAYNRLGQTDRASELVAELEELGFEHPIIKLIHSITGATVGD